MPRVTVLMPVRNGGPYLRAAVESILAQTYPDFELLVVDDGSTDDTVSVLASFAARDARIRTISRPSAGLVDALNFGLSKADCEFVARMDADDIALPRRLEHQLRFLAARPGHIVCGVAYSIFGASRAFGMPPCSNAACKATLLLFPCFAHSTTMLRRAALLETGIRYRKGFPHCEDYQLWSELAAHGRFANIPRLLMRYRAHAGQTSALHARIQRETHAKIAACNLRARGADDITEARIHRFLWPGDALDRSERLSRSVYLRESLALVRRLLGLTGGHGGRLAVTMLNRLARNLVALQ
jgi:glycosyltransferase involved in cell wall biosynthesis